MITENKSITMAEAKEILKDYDTEKSKAVSSMIKKFTKLSAEESKKLFSAIKKLNLEKLKDEDIIKIIDFLPDDAESLRKIFTGSDIAFDQDETSKILNVIK
jgi:DNA-directed RNA polymerase subunit F